MNLLEATATKLVFRRKASANRAAGRWIEQAESCGLRFFRFQKPVLLENRKEPVIFEPSDIEAEYEIQETKKSPIKRALSAAMEIVEALKEMDVTDSANEK